MVYQFGKHQIEIYDSTQNIPILRFQKCNKYQMIASEIGNDFNDYDQRTQKTIEFLKKNMIEEAIQELNNRRQTVFNAYNEFTPIGRSFAVLVHRIDDVHYKKYAPDDLDQILKHLNDIGFDIQTSIEKLAEVKKKIETELFVYFPKQFPEDSNPQLTALKVSRLDLLCDEVIEQREMETQLFNIEHEILMQQPPNVWNVYQENNLERILEVDFHKYMIAVKEHIGIDPEETTAFMFFAAVEYLTEKTTSNT